MRNNVFIHEYEAVFYVGIPLTVFSLVFLYIRRLLGARFVPVLAAAALPAFVLSSVEMGKGAAYTPEGGVANAGLAQDFEVIRGLLGGGAVYVPPGQLDEHWKIGSQMRYFLAGSVVLWPEQWRYGELADSVILNHRATDFLFLTPDNRRMFLHESYEEPAFGNPIIVSDVTSRWNVYWKDGRLFYVSEGCPRKNARFFLSVTPRQANELRNGKNGRGMDASYFHLVDIARRVGRRCIEVVDLPDHELASIRTGQLRTGARAGELIRKGEYRFER